MKTVSSFMLNLNNNDVNGMSRELREKADIVIKELKEILTPLSDEIFRIKCKEQNDAKDNNADY